MLTTADPVPYLRETGRPRDVLAEDHARRPAVRALWGSETSPGWLTSPCARGRAWSGSRRSCGMLSARASPIAVSSVRPAHDLAGAACARRRPRTPRSWCCATRSPCFAGPAVRGDWAVGGPGNIRRADPAAARKAARVSARHAGHGTALAPAAGAVDRWFAQDRTRCFSAVKHRKLPSGSVRIQMPSPSRSCHRCS